jgi:hypothetical protein
LREGIIAKDMAPVCPVDASGRFTKEVTVFVGEYVKVWIYVSFNFIFYFSLPGCGQINL